MPMKSVEGAWDLEDLGNGRTHATYTLDADPANVARTEEEIGDLLFAVTNIARHLKVEPEAALKLTNRKFRRRFGCRHRLGEGGNHLNHRHGVIGREVCLIGSSQRVRPRAVPAM